MTRQSAVSHKLISGGGTAQMCEISKRQRPSEGETSWLARGVVGPVERTTRRRGGSIMSSLHNLTILNSLSLHNLNTKYYTKPVLSVHYEMTEMTVQSIVACLCCVPWYSVQHQNVGSFCLSCLRSSYCLLLLLIVCRRPWVKLAPNYRII